jgi:predicted RecB family nuclease
MHIALGSGESESFRVADFAAYFRRVRSHFLDAVKTDAETEPYPVEHCGLCDFRPLCEAHWDAVDHLVRVAGIRRDQVERLRAADIGTLADLAAVTPGTTAPRIPASTFEKLRDQAALQHLRRETGRLAYHLLPPEEERGLGLLPEPSAGDLFLDLEGDPFWESDRKLEYLFGLLWLEGEDLGYRAFWAHADAASRIAVASSRLRRVKTPPRSAPATWSCLGRTPVAISSFR